MLRHRSSYKRSHEHRRKKNNNTGETLPPILVFNNQNECPPPRISRKQQCRTGPTGAVGMTGSPGFSFTGEKGDTGVQGDTGPVGMSLTGATGQRGIQGDTGSTGESFTGPTGPPGSSFCGCVSAISNVIDCIIDNSSSVTSTIQFNLEDGSYVSGANGTSLSRMGSDGSVLVATFGVNTYYVNVCKISAIILSGSDSYCSSSDSFSSCINSLPDSPPEGTSGGCGLNCEEALREVLTSFAGNTNPYQINYIGDTSTGPASGPINSVKYGFVIVESTDGSLCQTLINTCDITSVTPDTF